MSKNIRTQTGKIIGKTLNTYHSKLKPKVDDLKFKEQYQGRIIDCMVGEIDDNYIETPETNSAIVKLEHSKEGLVKVPSIKGKTILIDVEGNETDTPAEGCRLVSVGESEDNKLIILSKNKNIVGKLTHSSINTGGSLNTSFNGKYRVRTDFIKLEDGVDYIVSTDGYLNRFIAFYYSEPNHESFTRQGSWTLINNNMLTRNASDKYVILEFNINHDSNMIIDIDKCKVQLERGNRSTNYTEPKEHKTEILLKEPLRKLPNGICDEIVGNRIVRKIGRIMVKGIENWKHQAIQSDGRQRVSLKVDNMKIGCVGTSNKIIWKTKITNDIAEITKEPFIGSHIDTNTLNLCIPNINSIDDVKRWLSENPIEVLFELAEPIIEELPNGITLQGFDDTTMYIENEIIPTIQYGYNALIPYKEELRTQKEEVETNTLDIENNIIPYLMDMEFNLMLMEDN